ncbi:MAG: TraR/DksA C4-type zinc finger protein [Patescibacteria group bacterium]
MLNTEFLTAIKDKLLEEEGNLSHELENLEKENPLLNPERTSSRIPEWEEESSQMEAANKTAESIKLLKVRLKDTQAALAKLEAGTYGKCEVCGAEIDRARLEANPQAHFDIEHEPALAEEA